MPQSYHFKCKNGHDFDAVAKLRSRCPECQSMTIRNSSLSSQTTTTTPISKLTEQITPSSTPSSPQEEKPVLSDIGSKPALSSEQHPIESKSEKSTPKARILRQGMKPAPKKPLAVVKKSVAPKHTMPTVTAKPQGSQQHKTMERPAASYGQGMMEKYFGFGRKRP